MEIKYESTYYVEAQTFKGVRHLDEEFITKVKDYLEGYETVDEDDLIDAIMEIIHDNYYEEFINPKDKSTLDYVDDIQVDNYKELAKFFSHFIKMPSCCDKAPYGSNYCPTCGKKL